MQLLDLPTEVLALVMKELSSWEMVNWDQNKKDYEWLGRRHKGWLKDKDIEVIVWDFANSLGLCNALLWQLYKPWKMMDWTFETDSNPVIRDQIDFYAKDAHYIRSLDGFFTLHHIQQALTFSKRSDKRPESTIKNEDYQETERVELICRFIRQCPNIDELSLDYNDSTVFYDTLVSCSAKLSSLSLEKPSPGPNGLNEYAIAKLISQLPALKILYLAEIDTSVYDNSRRYELRNALASLSQLHELEIQNCVAINDKFFDIPWSAALKDITIRTSEESSITEMTHKTLDALLARFASSLCTLEITPRDEEIDEFPVVNLPNLKTLTLSASAASASILKRFAKSSLSSLCFISCEGILFAELSQLILDKTVPGLKTLDLVCQDLDASPQELEAWRLECEKVKVVFEILPYAWPQPPLDMEELVGGEEVLNPLGLIPPSPVPALAPNSNDADDDQQTDERNEQEGEGAEA